MLVCPLCRVALDASETTCPRDGGEGEEHTFGALAEELRERFTIVAPFARGATGDLFLVDDKESGRRGILKILHATSGVSASERQRLKRELTKQATLSNPNLALPAISGEAEGSLWLFREWVEGVSLQVRLSRGGPLATPEALFIAAELAGALDELHRAGLLHRDLKPGHVLLQPQPSGLPKVVLIDAGIAAHIETDDAFEVAGSPRYLSPEQATGKLESFRSDLYSLGVVAYEMFQGRPPFEGDDVANLLLAHAEFAVPTDPVEAPPGVQALVAQLLAKDPRDRPFSAQQSKRVIEPFLPQGNGLREATTAFDAASAESPPAVIPRKGTGTLRPAQMKATISGMPIASKEPTKPPPPPVDQPIRQSEIVSKPPPPPKASASAPAPAGARSKPVSSVPPPTPPAALPDATQELDALDLEQVEAALIQASPAASAAPQANAPAAQGQSDLDYDDLAETTAIDRGEADALFPDLPGPSTEEPFQASPAPAAAATDFAAPTESSPGQISAFERAAEAVDAMPTAASSRPPGPLAVAPVAIPLTTAQPVVSAAQVAATAPSVASNGLPAAIPANTLQPVTPMGPGLAPSGPLPAAIPANMLQPVTPMNEGPRKTRNTGNTGAPQVSATAATAAMTATPMANPIAGATPAVGLQPVGIPAEKKSKMPMIIGALLVGACLISSAAVGGVYWVLSSSVESYAEFNEEGLGAAEGLGPMAGLAEPGALPAEPGVLPLAVEPNLDLVPAEAAPTVAELEPQAAAEPELEPIVEPQAVTALEPALDEAPDRSAHTDRGSGRRVQGAPSAQPTRAERPAAAPRGGNDLDALRDQAREHWSAGNFAGAAAAYERAAALAPRNAAVFMGLGSARFRMNDYRGAVTAYERAVELSPRNSGYLTSLGRALHRTGNAAGARQALQRALALDPNNRAARRGLEQMGN